MFTAKVYMVETRQALERKVFFKKKGLPAPGFEATFRPPFRFNQPSGRNCTVRDDYLKQAQQIIPDPNILINVISRRAKQLKLGNKPLIESLEKLDPEDVALREVIEGKISYSLGEEEPE